MNVRHAPFYMSSQEINVKAWTLEWQSRSIIFGSLDHYTYHKGHLICKLPATTAADMSLIRQTH